MTEVKNVQTKFGKLEVLVFVWGEHYEKVDHQKKNKYLKYKVQKPLGDVLPVGDLSWVKVPQGRGGPSDHNN